MWVSSASTFYARPTRCSPLAKACIPGPHFFIRRIQGDFWNGVGLSFFGALTALSLLGIRYPLRMLPVLFFELAWKLIWALAIWLPPLLNHTLTADVGDSAPQILPALVVVPLVLPWGYVWKTYVRAPADRWR